MAQSRPWQRPGAVGESSSNQLPQTFLWTFLAACTALLAIAAVHYYSLCSSERLGRETSEQVSVELVRRVLVADLMVLARHIEQMTLTDRDVPDPELERVFNIFAEQKRLYDQIRFIDNAGRETLRVDLRDGRAFSVPRPELQDKSARYYVSAAQTLAPGEIYISPLDLNVEQGEIERPYKPMMRFATGVIDADGASAGIVVLNYLGQRLLDGVARAAGPAADHLHLVDPRGYWLLGPGPSDAWGFMLGHDRTFAARYPQEWRTITARDQGRILSGNGLFTFSTASPHPFARAAAADAQVGDASVNADAGFSWKLIALLPLNELAISPGAFLVENAALYSAMLALLALGSFLLARARVHHHQAELQSEHERRFRRTLEYIELAAVALDRTGRITFCNRFFLTLTDWDREEVVGCAWLERFTPEGDRERMAQVLSTLDTPERFPPRYTCEVLTRSGRRRLLAWHTSLNNDAGGHPVGVTAIGEDITEQERNETAVRKLGQAVEQSPSIVIIKDREARIEYVNPKFTEVTGYALEEVLGENPRILKSGEMPAREYQELWRTLRQGGVWRGEFHNRRRMAPHGKRWLANARRGILRNAG